MSDKETGLAGSSLQARSDDQLSGSISSEITASTNAVKLAKKVARVLVKGAWRNVLPIHPAANAIPEATDAEKRSVAGDLDRRGQQMRVVLVRVAGGCQQLLDRRTRLDLLEGLGTEVVNAAGNVLVPHEIIDVASDAEAEAISLSLNLHRRHLKTDDRRKLAAAQIKAHPEKSDRQIAEQVKSNRTTVGQIRKALEKAGDVSIVDTRTDTKGRKQPATKVKVKPDELVVAPAEVGIPESVIEAHGPLQAEAIRRIVQRKKRERAKDEKEKLAVEIERLASKLIELDRDTARRLHDLLWSDACNGFRLALARGLGLDDDGEASS